MEMEKREILKHNLKTLYDIEIWLIGCLVLALVPFVNVVVVIVAPILGIIGAIARWNLREIHPDYRSAVIAMVLGIVTGLLGSFLWEPFGFIDSICKLAQTYFTVRATNALLTDIRETELVELGDKVWLWTLYSTIGGVVVDVLGALGSSPFLLLPAIISLVISVMAMVYELKYLKGSSEAF